MAPPELRPTKNVWLSRAKIKRARLSLSPVLRFRNDGQPDDDPRKFLTFLRRTVLRPFLPCTAEAMQWLAFKSFENKGDMIKADGIFVVCRGEIFLLCEGEIVSHLKSGDSFNELCFLLKEYETRVAIAATDHVIIAELSTGAIEKLVLEDPRRLLNHCRDVLGHELRVARFALEQWWLDETTQQEEITEEITAQQKDNLKALIKGYKYQEYRQGQTLPNKGLHIILQGQVYDSVTNLELDYVSGLGFLCGGEANFGDKVVSDTVKVITFNEDDFEQSKAQILLTCIKIAAASARHILERWSRSGLRRRFVLAGERLPCDGIAYLVLSGRVRSLRYRSRAGHKKLCGARDAQRGDVVGLTDLLLLKKQNKNDSLETYAARDAEVIALPRPALNVMPASCALSLVRRQLQRKVGNSRDSGGILLEPTVLCVLPTSAAAISLASNLAISLAEHGLPSAKKAHPLRTNAEEEIQMKIKCVDGTTARQRFGEYLEEALFGYGRAKIATTWLATLESEYQKVVLIADLEATTWTRVAVSSADAVLLVADSSAEFCLGPGERELMLQHAELPGARSRLLLALCHPPETQTPRDTRRFLAPRPRLDEPRVVHVRRQSSNGFLSDDVRRLGRFLAGRACGIVLGGGGARGLAHLGALRSLEAAGVQIDLLIGCSQGAMCALLAAKEAGWPSSSSNNSGQTLKDTERRLQNFAACLASTRKVIMDLNWLRMFAVSTFTGKGFALAVRSAFDSDSEAMEDSWLPRYCVTTDATVGDERVHGCGDDGPESCLASMSVCGYFPPIVYSRDGHLLVDGGYCSNLPAAQMRSIVGDAGFVIAVDVEAKTHNLVLDPTIYHWSNGFSGMRGFIGKLLGKNDFCTSALDLNAQLLYIRNAAQLRDARTSGAFDICLRLESVMRFSFTAYDRLHDIANAAQAQAASLIQTHLSVSDNNETLLSPTSGKSISLNEALTVQKDTTQPIITTPEETTLPPMQQPKSLGKRVASSLSAPKTKAVLRRLCSFPSQTTTGPLSENISALLDSLLHDRDIETAARRRTVSVDAPLGIHRDGHILLGDRLQDGAGSDDDSLDDYLDDDLIEIGHSTAGFPPRPAAVDRGSSDPFA
eukprot:CAMPEP_0197292456 /NCGR_PEP_ID=MMETSP0890-20130614/23439_1 /TAXON_ID=44058 ORGANISM="Aureoumbra lagunensis, Strain CCMP1510" /NCGR_SAMPLE_ID=MMETSP0890 /ASSEMBLY_ACC=CAM_ASM_000533 /LENGTH=1109 /DNA_ID=CAMNT_0042766389 /DNA_START=132 /DNA_END=3461 /DNA_ORIENTATION=-